MSLLWSRRAAGLSPSMSGRVNDALGERRGTAITEATAMRHSAVWACTRLRADIESTLPLDVFRRSGVDGIQYETAPTPFIRNPAGDRFGRLDWLYSSRVSLDRAGNSFGVIRAFDALGKPATVELVSTRDVTVRGIGPTITGYTVRGKRYEPEQIWHERQFTEAGLPIGLSPVAHAAITLGIYGSAQEYAVNWYEHDSTPSGVLRNTEMATLTPEQSAVAKARFKAATANRDIFTTGKDWEFSPYTITAGDTAFLESMKFSVTDVCRFFGVPGDLIDAEQGSSSITYANITQRNLQFLIMHMGPALVRREAALSAALPAPRYVKFNTDALLRMDPASRETMLGGMVTTRRLAPSEARELDNRPPFTEEQMAEFDRLFGTPTRNQPATAAVPKED